MYEAMRQRAPNSTRITGLGVTLLVASLAAYAALQAGTRIVRAIEAPTVLVNVAPRQVQQDRQHAPSFPDETTFRLPVPPIPQPLDREFVIDEPVTTGAAASPVTRTPPRPAISSAIRIGPKLEAYGQAALPRRRHPGA